MPKSKPSRSTPSKSSPAKAAAKATTSPSGRLIEATLSASQRRSQSLAKALGEARDVMRKVARGD